MKLFVLSVLSLFAFNANVLANGYCDGRQTQRDMDNCYRLAIQAEDQKLQKTLGIIMASPKLSDDQKRSVQQSHKQWANLVNTQCRLAVCVETSIRERNGLMLSEFRKIK